MYSMKINAIIYDFDGTLADTFSLHLEAYAFSLGKFGIEATHSEIINKCFNKTDEKAAENFGISDTEQFSKYYREGLKEAFKKIKLYPNVISTLKTLVQQGVKLGIATSRERKEMESVLDILKMRSYFEVIITHDEVVEKKPNPEIFLAVCNQLSVSSNDIVIVGDSQADLDAARQMNARSVLFYPEEHKKIYELENLKKYEPTFIINDNKDILSIFQKSSIEDRIT